MNIGERIKKIRYELHIMQKDFAERIDTTRNAIYSYESNTSVPGYKILSRICSEFNVNPDFLLLGNSPMFIDSDRGILRAQVNPETITKIILQMEKIDEQ